MAHDSKYDWGKDWRGTPIGVGAVVVYHVQTRGGKTVEAEVISVTDGDNYRGKTIMVRPLKESGIGVARPPTAYTREDKKLFAVPQLNVTVLTPAPKKSFVQELVDGQMIRRNEKTLQERDDPRCFCGDYALFGVNGPKTTCGPNGCYNCPA